ncbi:unnamed protein product [marine sediment metagenome]|uniref:Uncharacterized protein n=1 Tax=marine sediment metagenome TaxID=412755 RepID=X1TFN2_9ZZZZ
MFIDKVLNSQGVAAVAGSRFLTKCEKDKKAKIRELMATIKERKGTLAILKAIQEGKMGHD